MHHTMLCYLVHVFEDLLQRSFFTHEFSKGQTTIKVTVHPLKKIRNLIPKQIFIRIVPGEVINDIEVLHPDELRTLYHSSLVSFPSPSLSALSNIFRIWKIYSLCFLVKLSVSSSSSIVIDVRGLVNEDL